MSFDTQFDGLRRMVPDIREDEFEVLLVGTIQAPGLGEREGMLFATREQLGISSVGDGSEKDAWMICGYDEVTGVGTVHAYDPSAGAEVSTPPQALKATTAHGTFRISDIYNGTHAPDQAAAMIQVFCNRVCRPDTRQRLDQAEQRYIEGDFAAAKGIITRVLKGTQPGCIEAYALLARVCLALGQVDEAVSAHMAQLESGAENPALIHLEIASIGNQIGDHHYAVEQATISLNYGLNAAAYQVLGWAKFHMGDHSGGIQDMRLAARFEPDNADYWACLANFAYQLRDWRELKRVIDRLEALPDASEQSMWQVLYLRRTEQYEEAVRIGEELLEQYASTPWFAREFIFAANHSDFEVGLRAMSVLDPHHQNDLMYLMNTALILIQAGEAPQAHSRLIAYFQKFDQNLSPDDTQLIFAGILLSRLAQQSDDASAAHAWPALRSLVESSDWVVDSFGAVLFYSLCFYAGKALLDAGELDESLKYFDRAYLVGKFDPLNVGPRLPAYIEKAEKLLAQQLLESQGWGISSATQDNSDDQPPNLVDENPAQLPRSNDALAELKALVLQIKASDKDGDSSDAPEELRAQIAEILTNSRQAAQQLDAEIEAYIQAAETQKSALNQWERTKFSDLIDEAGAQIDVDLNAILEMVTQEIVKLSPKTSPRGFARLNALAPGFQQIYGESWRHFHQTIAGALGTYIERVDAQLNDATSDALREAFQPESSFAGELATALPESLLKEINFLQGYSAGFFDAEPLHDIVWRSSDDALNDPEYVHMKLWALTHFLSARPADTARQWSRDTAAQLHNRIGHLQQAARHLAAQHRRQTHRPIQYLAGLYASS